MAAVLALRAPTSRVVAGSGSWPPRSPPRASCRTSTAPSPPGSTGREVDRRRTRRDRRHGSDRQPPQRGRQVLPALRGGSPRPPSAPFAAPTCRTRARGYSGVQHRRRRRPASRAQRGRVGCLQGGERFVLVRFPLRAAARTQLCTCHPVMPPVPVAAICRAVSRLREVPCQMSGSVCEAPRLR